MSAHRVDISCYSSAARQWPSTARRAKSLNERAPDSALASKIMVYCVVNISAIVCWTCYGEEHKAMGGYWPQEKWLIGYLKRTWKEGRFHRGASAVGHPRVGDRQKEDAARVPPITATIYAEEQSIRVPLLLAVFMTR